jgi:hypothetical protein
MVHYPDVARENGKTDEEIGAEKTVAMALSAGKISAQFREVVHEQKKKIESIILSN